MERVSEEKKEWRMKNTLVASELVESHILGEFPSLEGQQLG